MPRSFPILLIDDDPDLLDILSLAAQTSFPEAFFTQLYSYEQACTYFQNELTSKLSLIILDINLGGPRTGLDLLVYLRSLPRTRFWPIIVLTVIGEAQAVKQAYSAGASSYSVKPFTLVEWKSYLATLRLYWVETVKLPPYW